MLAPATTDTANGCRAAFAGAAVETAAGLVAQHRALRSNTHSLRIARRLGFVPCAASLAVRLRDV